MRSHKLVEIMIYLNFSTCWWKDPDRILEAQKHTDPTDPDPEHCPKHIRLLLYVQYGTYQVGLEPYIYLYK